MMKRLHIKAIVSSLLLLIFLFLAISGAMLYFGKTGVVMGFTRSGLRSAHTCAAIAMCLLVLVHLFINRRLYFNELKSLFGRGEKK